MSMGAGRPKFRIWLTMSPGWKKNVAFGNFLGSSWRSGFIYLKDARGLVRGNHLLDARLNGAKELVDLLDPHPRRRPDVKAELPSVDLRKEVLAGERSHPQRHAHEAAEGHEDGRPMAKRPGQHAAIALSKRLEAPVEGPMQPPEEIAV